MAGDSHGNGINTGLTPTGRVPADALRVVFSFPVFLFSSYFLPNFRVVMGI